MSDTSTAAGTTASGASSAPTMLFLNLPVKDLQASIDFFTTLGFTFNRQFTDETATCMVINDTTFVMLLVEPKFREFTPKQVADATTHTEAIMCISAGSREQVDELTEKALRAGGSPSGDPIEEGLMYGRSFQDIDGHLWEVMWMEMGAAAPGEQA